MLQVGHFISVATQLAINACEIIKQASQNTQLGKYEKGIDDPVTEADYHVQTMIIEGLRRFFPQLKVIGEQTVDYKGQVKVNYENFDFDFLPQNTKFKDILVPYNEICVWIDPIDCTKGFISGQMDYVTNLIGMSRNKKAYIGIVGVPYKKVQGKIQYQPSITCGVSQTKQAFTFLIKDKIWQQIHPQPLNDPLKMTNTKGRVCEKFLAIQSLLKAESKFAEGTGKKIMMVINGQVDLMVYLLSFNSKWDTCAGQAIVKALGGYFLTPNGQEIIYDPNSDNFKNPEGQVCCLNHDILTKVLDYLKKEEMKK